MQPTTMMTYCDNQIRQSAASPLVENISERSAGSIMQGEEKDGFESVGWSSQNSFFADSPYYNAFVEKEMDSLETISISLEDIVSKTALFSKAGDEMALSTRKLAMSCKLSPDDCESNCAEVELRRKALGPKLSALLGQVGKMLEEIATAQENMCKNVQEILNSTLTESVINQIDKTSKLKDDALIHTEKAERMLFKYLNKTHSGGNNGQSQSAGINSNEESSSKIEGKHYEQSLWKPKNMFKRPLKGQKGTKYGYDSDSNRSLSSSRSGKTPTSKDNNLLSDFSTRTYDTELDDLSESCSSYSNFDEYSMSSNPAVMESDNPTISKALNLAKSKYKLEQIRVTHARAELKRYRLCRHFIDAAYQRNLDISESAGKMLRELHSYFETCSHVLNKMMPDAEEDEKQFSDLYTSHLGDEFKWREREQLINQILTQLKRASIEAYEELEDISEGDGSSIEPETLNQTQENLESAVKLWDLPSWLAGASQYRRPSPPGVKLEGWVYKRSSKLVTMNPWNRQWFVVKDGGIFAFTTSSDRKTKSVGTHYTTKTKLCDIVLCTVRELPDDGTDRYCFQVVCPNRKSIIVKTRGPHELKMWLDGIQSAIADQLVVGGSTSAELNQGIGRKFKRQSNEIMEAVMDTMLYQEVVHQEQDQGFGESPNECLTCDQSPHVKRVMQVNASCADCGKPSPDWVSLNLGVLVCINCSGVHRSLGVHVSKIRSLTLDSLSDREARLVMSLGNDRMNAIFERTANQDEKINEFSDRSTREEWIKNKYINKLYLCETQMQGQLETSRFLYEAAGQGDIYLLAMALALGGDVNWKNYDVNGGETALSACINSREGKTLECVEFLMQNGATTDTLSWSDAAELECILSWSPGKNKNKNDSVQNDDTKNEDANSTRPKMKKQGSRNDVISRPNSKTKSAQEEQKPQDILNTKDQADHRNSKMNKSSSQRGLGSKNRAAKSGKTEKSNHSTAKAKSARIVSNKDVAAQLEESSTTRAKLLFAQDAMRESLRRLALEDPQSESESRFSEDLEVKKRVSFKTAEDTDVPKREKKVTFKETPELPHKKLSKRSSSRKLLIHSSSPQKQIEKKKAGSGSSNEIKPLKKNKSSRKLEGTENNADDPPKKSKSLKKLGKISDGPDDDELETSSKAAKKKKSITKDISDSLSSSVKKRKKQKKDNATSK